MTTPFPKEITIGDKYSPAMAITDAREADAYFARCVAHTMEAFGKSREDAERYERWNLGYFAGYYDTATRKRVEDLFGAKHPQFGSVERGIPSPETILAAGMLQAMRIRRGDATPTAAMLDYRTGSDAMPREAGDGICIVSQGKEGAHFGLFWTDSAPPATRHTVMMTAVDTRLLESMVVALERVIEDVKRGEPSQYLIELHRREGGKVDSVLSRT